MSEAVTRLELTGISKRYGHVRALHAFDLRVEVGEVVGVIGENGAGKSTMLGVLAGMIRPDAGEVSYWAGPTRLSPTAMRAAVGVVSHAAFLYPELSAAENLRFFLRLYGRAGTSEEAEALLERVGLDRRAWARPVRTYSRGMTQRVSLARALVGEPSVLLLDEPFSGLDREGVALLRRVMAAERERGAIIVVVSHETAPLARLATRVLAVWRGRHVGTCEAPASQRDIDGLYDARTQQVLGQEPPT